MTDIGWSTNTDWTNAQATTNIDINSGTFELADAIPDGTVDNFEDANGNPEGVYQSGETVADYYNGDTGNWRRTTSNVTQGSYALETDGVQGSYIHSVDNGLPEYPSEGDTVKFLIRGIEENGCSPALMTNVGGEPDINGYAFVLYADSGIIYIDKITSESYSTLVQDNTISVSVRTWYWGEASLPTSSDNTITFSLYELDSGNTRGSLISSISANDNEYASNTGIGANTTSSSNKGTVLDWIRTE